MRIIGTRAASLDPIGRGNRLDGTEPVFDPVTRGYVQRMGALEHAQQFLRDSVVTAGALLLGDELFLQANASFVFDYAAFSIGKLIEQQRTAIYHRS